MRALIRRLSSPTLLLAAGSAVVIAVGAALVVSALSSVRVADATQDARQSAIGFTQSVSNWLVLDTDLRLNRVARLADVMLLSGAVYVQITYREETIVDARAPDWEAFTLAKPASGVGPAQASTELTTAHDLLVFDSHVPFVTGEGGFSLVRLGVHARLLEEQLQSLRFAGVGIGLGLWLAVLVLVTVLGLRRAPELAVSPSRHPSPEPAIGDESFSCGPLCVDVGRKLVIVDGEAHSFPPKLFTLLELLTYDENRVFSDEEILERVWTDAKYAGASDVRQCVYRLRRQLNHLKPGLSECVRNVKGFGYRWDSDAVAEEEPAPEPVPNASAGQ